MHSDPAISTPSPKAPFSKRRRRLRIWLIALLSLVAIRIALPYVLLRFANQRLATMPGYYGHINDLDLAIYRGAYRIESFYLDQVDSTTHERTQFIGAELIDLSVEWKALFEGGLVGELEIEKPLLRFTLNKTEPAEI